MLQFIIDQCKTQDMREKAVNDYRFMLKFVSYWSVTPKTLRSLIMLKTLMSLLFGIINIKTARYIKKYIQRAKSMA